MCIVNNTSFMQFIAKQNLDKIGDPAIIKYSLLRSFNLSI